MKSLLLLAALAGTAAAQSKRYPPEPADSDADADAHSHLWEQALTPSAGPYAELISAGVGAVAQRTPDQFKLGIDHLTQAIALQPDAPEAYYQRGLAYFSSTGAQDYAACARDLAAAEQRGIERTLTGAPLSELPRALGLCQARSGDLAGAERTLSEATATRPDAELLMRLGEVRIALGKLDEALAALDAALDQHNGDVSEAFIRWLRAGAYDRARRPAEAHEEAMQANQKDRSYSTLVNPALPMIGVGEPEYLLGLAYGAAEPARPELSLLYFRRFLALAKDSPWRKRAEEHVREIHASDLPGDILRGGTAPFDREAARLAVGKALPPMRACLAKLPGIAVLVQVTKVGPRTPSTDRTRPSFFSPNPGIVATVPLNLDETPTEASAAAAHCIEGLAAKLPLPAPKERDTHYTAAFYVVGP
ncbi:MAG TPA: tetratricopeptide repeat protein [Kofleriaceae bacterium]